MKTRSTLRMYKTQEEMDAAQVVVEADEEVTKLVVVTPQDLQPILGEKFQSIYPYPGTPGEILACFLRGTVVEPGGSGNAPA